MNGNEGLVAPDDRPEGELKYRIRLLIKHPIMDPAAITSKLGFKPGLVWTAGTRRKTPAGTPLPGVHKTSAWGYWFDVEGGRFFSQDVLKLLLQLEERAEFIRELIDSGGSIGLYVNLPGDVNIGDEIAWADLRRFVSLRINFGVEVFPNYQSTPEVRSMME
jgi:hypothetical protein